MALTALDFGVLALYAIILFAIALYVSREKDGGQKTTEDYFLAGRSLPWWAIGASLIAANISAEQIIGMSGEGYRIGLAIAAYEWQAALVLILVAKFFLPIFLKREIYTMPQFLDQRFGTGVKTTMSIYWIALYTLVNLTTVLWLGGLAVETLTGLNIIVAMAALGAFAIAYSIVGGLKAVALTDIIQVIILVLGGLVIAFMTVSMIGGGSLFGGLSRMVTEMPDKFDMIFEPTDEGYDALPGIWTILGGLWILHLNYWGFNQYIIQRALGAKDLAEAQKGLVFAAGLKMIMPLIIVVPGIAAVLLAAPEMGVLDGAALDAQTDRTYPSIMSIMPAGFRGLIFAALIAAIVSSLASMVNSISTIATMDVYKAMLSPNKSEHHYVTVGRVIAVSAMIIAVIAARPFLGGFESAFQTVQEYTGFIAPGVVAVFLLGMFYARANSAGAFTALIVSVAGSILVAALLPDIQFVNRIWIIFLLCVGLGILVSHLTAKPAEARLVRMGDVSFATRASFNVWSLAIIALLVLLYVVFW
ncbi:MAG: sodium/solute symporter [Pseudomonadota bacterium]